MATDVTGQSSRPCIRCGTPLSRYNMGDTCATCGSPLDAELLPLSETSQFEHLAAGDSAGQAIRAWRIGNGRRQAEVAAQLGMTQQHLSQIETGRRPLSLELRRRLVQELGIPATDLGLAESSRPAVEADLARDVAASRWTWRNQRRWLNQHRSDLARLAVGLYPPDLRISRSPIIASPDWRLPAPIELTSIALELDEGPKTVEVSGSEPESEAVRPLHSSGARFDRYTAAIRHLDPPHLFESRPSYRFLEGSPAAGRLGFGMAAYFDKLDISEALGHELAAACMELGGVPEDPNALDGRLPFRELVRDPFDAGRRAIIPAITTLTIRLRRYPAEPSFLLHWRDPEKVATAGGVYDVVPAGEFQPSSVALWDRRADFDLWRNIVREYSEELLGTPEHDGTRTEPITYGNWELYQQLQGARDSGSAYAAILGMGVDALTLAATILTVVVLDDDVFGQAFGSAVRYNDEGEIVAVAGGVPMDGVPFTAESVSRMLDRVPMASPGAACLSLAWEHRSELLGL